MTQSPRAEVRKRILTSARELYRAQGVRGVTMSDVATQAGCSRQLVYKVFFDRRELVLAAVVARIEEIADGATSPVDEVGPDPDSSFISSFVELSVTVIERLRTDEELATLFGDGSPVTPYEALWTTELIERALQFWQPWLDWGRAHHRLRDDLSNRDLADWLHTVYASIVLRRNIPPDQERSLIERFVLTSLAMATIERPAR